MPEVQTERVLVVPTELFRRLGYFQGFCGDVDRYLGELLSGEHISYRPRGQVELDPGFKQLIPYVIFRHTDHQQQETVFQYTRGTGQGEGRLHRKHSVGIGGHISAVDADAAVGDRGSSDRGSSDRGSSDRGSSDRGSGDRGYGDRAYEEGMRRELEEEVRIDTPYTARCVGLINDDQTEVGRVHLGVVHLFDVERPAVRPNEPEIIQSGFRPVAEILADMAGFETWSVICMQALFGEDRQRWKVDPQQA